MSRTNGVQTFLVSPSEFVAHLSGALSWKLLEKDPVHGVSIPDGIASWLQPEDLGIHMGVVPGPVILVK